MGVDQQVRELAERTSNFGHLLAHEPLLVAYGAAAEASVFADPNTAMIKCRQFGEALTTRAFIQFGVPSMPQKQYQRLKVLSDQGFLTKRVHSWFDDVRLIGNRAVHEGYAAQRDALQLVRTCYELGAWFHRTVSGSRDAAPPFVPPQLAVLAEPTSAEESRALRELRQLLQRYHAELVEMKTKLDERTTAAAAEAAAQAAANQEILRGVQAQAGTHQLIQQLSTKVDELQRQLSANALAAAPIDAASREEYVERAVIASRPLLTEAQTRRIIDRMPTLLTEDLRPAQVEAITELERSLAKDRPRALIQMATGAGKTFTMVTETYRLLRHAGAGRVLFLVDRNNLGRQAESEFENFRTPDDGTPFGELYNVQRLRSGVVLGSTHVVISTVQRLYSMLHGEELPDDDAPDDYQVDDVVEVAYNPAVPPETFDLVIVDECHRSIYGKWRAVLEYFDAHLVGLTATPVAQTFGFFRQNLVSQYTYRQAVADGVNVDFDVMRISTEVGEHGGSIPANVPVRIVDRHTRRERYEQLDTTLDYSADAIGRSVMNPSQIRTVIQQFHDGWPQHFPHRHHVPKTLIFAKIDQHAEDVVEAVREIFGGDSRFRTKITYKAENPEQLISDFRNDAVLRIAVTVDMIATGTDVKPLECVLFFGGCRARRTSSR